MRHLTNLAAWDRILRIVVGAIMLGLGWMGVVPGIWGVALQLFGWFPVVTGLAGWCPVYVISGFRTRRLFGPTGTRVGRGGQEGRRI